MADDDDDEAIFGGLYQDGHWVWDDGSGALMFVSDLPPMPVEVIQKPMKAPTGAIEFRDDIDLIEQIRFRRRYQRKLKHGEMDIITLQVRDNNTYIFTDIINAKDVKDLAIYTAPTNILSPMLINMLHLSTTERFLRALILCTAYYLQLSEIMTFRVLELETKVRTLECEILENEFRDNLSDLRILVAKEYSTMLIGGSDTKKYHHMGPLKKRRSLSDKDARFFETLLRMSVQIVWLALGRKSFNQIELEINRLFKSEIFNAVEHNLKTGYVTKMMSQERAVLLGHCVRHDKKLNTRSPLMNEVYCYRDIDYRLTGLGVIKYNKLPKRLKYLWLAVAAKEEEIVNTSVVLGIIGMTRSHFDTMLRPIPLASTDKKSTTAARSTQCAANPSSGSVKKSTIAVQRLYPEIVIPEKTKDTTSLPDMFPNNPEPVRAVSESQRRRWQNRLQKLMHPPSSVKA